MSTSKKRLLALVVDVMLGGILLLLYLAHAHITMSVRYVDAIVPSEWLYIVGVMVAVAVTAWWLFSRR